MKKLHLTRFAAVATVALMGTTAAWGADGTGWSTVANTELQLFSRGTTNKVLIGDDDISSNLSGINKIVVFRDAAAKTYSTLMLPVAVKVNEAKEFTMGEGKVEAAYYPESYNPETFTLDMKSTDEIKANTPYIVEVSGTPQRFDFEKTSGSYTIVSTGDNEHATTLNSTCWQFTGSYVQNSWGSAENLYGFDAADGVFVKALSATIYPMRAYLTCKNASPVYGLGKVAAEETLPDVIKVRFLDKDGGTLSIGKMNTRTGDIQMQDRYYDLKGRKLNGKPQNKIMYVNKKVIKH
ncbi:hypothetical protein [Fibrobacter succinogenes]|uniref:hypothetical protein n=1 Tax=Fibrobacter succinogenes TaxID=833 RepID=UPI00156A0DA9|nr:hypothetical protein [Fibrobacter succinogenes]